eukprot:TRINITY_DN9923_c0_g1_i1.p1 TRINITY_DN9923_c0_g1~~TRINITY_DN9923_c0_g1_i1.p1  ORF type:complete len:471 (+),score=86.89 TRINITY_DN9923_c0_g1_i1:1090-2502(+)
MQSLLEYALLTLVRSNLSFDVLLQLPQDLQDLFLVYVLRTDLPVTPSMIIPLLEGGVSTFEYDRHCVDDPLCQPELFDALCRQTGLQSLVLSKIATRACPFDKIVANNCETLQTLRLLYCGPLNARIVPSLVVCKGLRVLALPFVEKLSRHDVMSILHACPALEDLDLRFSSVQALVSFEGSCTGLLRLRLEGNVATSADRLLTECAVNGRLQYLHLVGPWGDTAGYGITDDLPMVLGEGLVACATHCPITSLTLICVRWEDTPSHLQTVFEKCGSTLQTLDLGFSSRNARDHAVLHASAASLHSLTSLSCVGIDSEAQVKQTLLDHPQLRSLHVGPSVSVQLSMAFVHEFCTNLQTFNGRALWYLTKQDGCQGPDSQDYIFSEAALAHDREVSKLVRSAAAELQRLADEHIQQQEDDARTERSYLIRSIRGDYGLYADRDDRVKLMCPDPDLEQRTTKIVRGFNAHART